MATLTVAADEIGIHEQALVANTQDTVTFAQPQGASRDSIRVVNVDGAGALYFTVSGNDVDLANTKGAHWLPAVAGASKTRRARSTPASLRRPSRRSSPVDGARHPG